MTDLQTVKNKITRIQKDLSHLKEYTDISFDEIAKDYGKHKIVERIIEIVVNEAIDINQHIIVASGKGKLPFDFKQSFLLLAELKVYPEEFAKQISKSAGLRNILVHEYRQLDEQIFYHSIKECFEEYTRYCRYILDYLEKIYITYGE